MQIYIINKENVAELFFITFRAWKPFFLFKTTQSCGLFKKYESTYKRNGRPLCAMVADSYTGSHKKMHSEGHFDMEMSQQDPGSLIKRQNTSCFSTY